MDCEHEYRATCDGTTHLTVFEPCPEAGTWTPDPPDTGPGDRG
jgi:hypothetical protein